MIARTISDNMPRLLTISDSIILRRTRRSVTPPILHTNKHHTSQNVRKTCNPIGKYDSSHTFYVLPKTNTLQAFGAAARASRPVASSTPRFLTRMQMRMLSDEMRGAIDKAVASAPVVLFMKGTPETPQCGFSRASIQILGMQGLDPEKFTAFNVLEDAELRQGELLHTQS